MRVVLDHNVLVSGAISAGIPARILRAARAGRVALVVSKGMLRELHLVLARPRFSARLRMRGADPDSFIENYAALAKVIEQTIPVVAPALRDQDDAIILATALAGKVD